MTSCYYKNNELYIENIALAEIAKKIGTPCYVYSKAALLKNWHAFNNAFHSHPHRICYAVKANSNLAILHLFAKENSGFDIVSEGELERALKANANPSQIVFSGVGKTPSEIKRSLEVGIHCFNVESETELVAINNIAKQQNKIAPITLRINPNIDAKTHPYIATGLEENKFGIAYEDALRIMHQLHLFPNVKLIGIGCHIGSQLTELSPFIEALDRLLELINQLTIPLQHINLGGGLGVTYQDEALPSVEHYAQKICQKLANYSLELIIEPGRAIVANTGLLLTQITYIKETKQRNFAIIDAAMNDLLRPALYNAWHKVSAVRVNSQLPEKTYDIVGPVCESADFLAKERLLAIAPGDLLAIHTAGAYGFSISSNYNSRPKAAEVLVDQDKIIVIRQRERIADLFAGENMHGLQLN